MGEGKGKGQGSVVSQHSPVLHSGKGLLVGDVIHEQETHGSAVVGCGDRPVALLACCVLEKWQSAGLKPALPHPAPD